MNSRNVRKGDGRRRAVVYHNLHPGGALRAALELMNATSEEFSYDVVTLRLGTHDRDPVQTHELAMPNIGQLKVFNDRSRLNRALRGMDALSPVADLLAVSALERRAANWIAAQSYDVAIVHPCRVTQTPLLLRELAGVPTVYYMHEPRRRSFERRYNLVSSREGWNGLARRVGQPVLELALRRRDMKAADSAPPLVLCNSVFSKEAIARAYGLDATVSYLGVDWRAFSPGEVEASGRPFVLSVGGLEPAKGHELVIEALAALPSDRRPGLDIVHGRAFPQFEEELARRAMERGVRLRFHSGISDSDLADLYRQAAATVCAARLEPFGLTTLESLACGTPVVAVREGGFREVVRDKIDGYLVERDRGAMARAIDSVMRGNLPGDQENRASRIRDQWSWAAAGERFSAHVGSLFPSEPS